MSDLLKVPAARELPSDRLALRKEVLMNEIRKEPRRPSVVRRALKPRVLVTAAMTAVLLLGAVVIRGNDSGGDTAWGAELVAMAEGSPLLLIEESGWEVIRADTYSREIGEMTFSNGTDELELRWIPLDQHAGRVEDRRTASEATWDVEVAGYPAVAFRYESTDDYVVLWRDEEHGLEARGVFPDFATFQELVGTLKRVDVDGWLSAMPESVVKPDGRAAAVEEMLADVPIPTSLNVEELKAGERISDRYQLGAKVTGTVACAWIEQWVNAKATSNDASAKEAVDAMATSRDWAILIEMNEVGGWSEAVWELAEAIATDGLVFTGRQTPVEESYRSALGCPGG